MFRKLIVAAGAVLAVGLGAGTAQAAHVTIVDGAFDDGGTFSGWFDITPTNDVSAWDIVTTLGSAAPGDEYKNGDPSQSASTFLSFIAFAHSLGSDTNLLFIEPTGPDTLGAIEGEDEPARIGGANYRFAAAPEPGVWIMSILGFGLTGAALRRRKLAQA